jgi:hypothetical protein
MTRMTDMTRFAYCIPLCIFRYRTKSRESLDHYNRKNPSYPSYASFLVLEVTAPVDGRVIGTARHFVRIVLHAHEIRKSVTKRPKINRMSTTTFVNWVK